MIYVHSLGQARDSIRNERRWLRARADFLFESFKIAYGVLPRRF